MEESCGFESDSDSGSTPALSIGGCIGFTSLGYAACYERPNGGYACDCPDRDSSVASDEVACDTALVHACAGACESNAGRCAFDGEEYQCACAYGGSGPVTISPYLLLCQDVLKRTCEPSCSNPRGACYGNPAGWSFACRCAGDSDLHYTVWPDAGGIIKNCDGQLAGFCGEP
jgi:hypothetical protein